MGGRGIDRKIICKLHISLHLSPASKQKNFFALLQIELLVKNVDVMLMDQLCAYKEMLPKNITDVIIAILPIARP